MLRFFWRIIRLLVTLLIVGGGLYWGGPRLLAAAGRYLIARDTPAKADIAVVLPCQPYLLVPEAARVYHDGLTPKILLLNAPRPRGQEDLARIGIRYPDSLAISLQLLDKLRVPREAILTVPEPADGTQAEAEAVARFLASRPVRALVIVASKANSTRARKVFEATLGTRVRLTMHAAHSDPFDPERWWKNRTDRRQAVWEYGALVDWWLRGLWRATVGRSAAVPPAVTIR